MEELIPHIGISVSSVISGGVTLWWLNEKKTNKNKEEIEKLKKDIYYFKEIYERERKDFHKDIGLLFDKVKELCKRLNDDFSDIKADLRVLKHSARINGRK